MIGKPFIFSSICLWLCGAPFIVTYQNSVQNPAIGLLHELNFPNYMFPLPPLNFLHPLGHTYTHLHFNVHICLWQNKITSSFYVIRYMLYILVFFTV